jgi:outer membrane beta-barrel protein
MCFAAANTAWAGPRVQTAPLPSSPVEQYRIDANYGPDDALLNGIYERDGKLEISGGYAYQGFSSLMKYQAATGSLVIHINRRHAIEPLWFSDSLTSGLSSFDRDQVAAKKPSLASTLSVEVPKMIFAASYLYSPYHAKMHITERTVTHFDVYFGLGFALLRSEELFLDDHRGALQSRPGASIAAGLRFLFEPRWALRAELRDLVHQEKNFGSSMTANTLQLSLTASIFFGSFPERL